MRFRCKDCGYDQMRVGYNKRMLARNTETMVVTARSNNKVRKQWGAPATYLLLGRVRTDALRPLVDYKSKR